VPRLSPSIVVQIYAGGLLEKLYADSAYQGPIFANRLAEILPRLEAEITEMTLLLRRDGPLGATAFVVRKKYFGRMAS